MQGILHVDPIRGNLLKIVTANLPFPPREILTISGVPAGTSRGGHAHRYTHQFLILVKGIVEIRIVKKEGLQCYLLKSPGESVHMEPFSWGEQIYISPDSILQVYCSHEYNPSDYIFEFSELEQAWKSEFSEGATGITP